MSIRDIFSNRAVNGRAAAGTGTVLMQPDIQGSQAQNMGLGTTLYYVFSVSPLSAGVMNSLTIRYGTADADGQNFSAVAELDELFDATTNTDGVSPLGNTLIDLETNQPVVFPFDIDGNGGMQFALAINNPADTQQFVDYRILSSASNFATMGATALIGPLRYVDPTKVIGA